MPKLFDTSARYAIVLESDKRLPIDEQPTFICRALSSRELAVAIQQDAELASIESPLAAIDNLYKNIRCALVGWRNMRTDDGRILELFGLKPTGKCVHLPFRPELIDALLSQREANELLTKICNENNLDIDEKKGSGSQSVSSTVDPVEAAAQESAD